MIFSSALLLAPFVSSLRLRASKTSAIDPADWCRKGNHISYAAKKGMRNAIVQETLTKGKGILSFGGKCMIKRFGEEKSEFIGTSTAVTYYGALCHGYDLQGINVDSTPLMTAKPDSCNFKLISGEQFSVTPDYSSLLSVTVGSSQSSSLIPDRLSDQFYALRNVHDACVLAYKLCIESEGCKSVYHKVTFTNCDKTEFVLTYEGWKGRVNYAEVQSPDFAKTFESFKKQKICYEQELPSGSGRAVVSNQKLEGCTVTLYLSFHKSFSAYTSYQSLELAYDEIKGSPYDSDFFDKNWNDRAVNKVGFVSIDWCKKGNTVLYYQKGEAFIYKVKFNLDERSGYLMGRCILDGGLSVSILHPVQVVNDPAQVVTTSAKPVTWVEGGKVCVLSTGDSQFSFKPVISDVETRKMFGCFAKCAESGICKPLLPEMTFLSRAAGECTVIFRGLELSWAPGDVLNDKLKEALCSREHPLRFDLKQGHGYLISNRDSKDCQFTLYHQRQDKIVYSLTVAYDALDYLDDLSAISFDKTWKKAKGKEEAQPVNLDWCWTGNMVSFNVHGKDMTGQVLKDTVVTPSVFGRLLNTRCQVGDSLSLVFSILS